MAGYRPIQYNNVVLIDELFTIHFFHFEPNHQPIPESHNFYELIYLDRNSAWICTCKGEFLLSQGEIILLEPGIEHGIRGDGKSGADIGIVSFSSSSDNLSAITNRILTVDVMQRGILGEIMNEAASSFGMQLEMSHCKDFSLAENAPLGGVQIIRLYTEIFLLHMLRHKEKPQCQQVSFVEGSPYKKIHNEVLRHAIGYMRQNLDGKLSLADVCREVAVSATALRRIFHKNCDVSPMGYYNALRIAESKRLLREGSLNITQIADLLGFSSPNYFSSRFKNEVGMSPTQYKRSIFSTDKFKRFIHD